MVCRNNWARSELFGESCAARPVPAAEVAPTSWCSAATCPHKALSYSPAAPNASAPEGSTRIWDVSCGCNPNLRRQEEIMTVGLVFSSIGSLKQRIEHRRRIRTALHLLSASGVLRPSHVELRYASALTRKRLGERPSLLARSNYAGTNPPSSRPDRAA